MGQVNPTFHKLKKDERIKAAEALTEAFTDYPQLTTLYPCKNKKRYRRKVYDTFLFWIYTLSDSFYANDEVDCVVCMEKPTDKNPGTFALFAHPLWLLRCVFCDFSVADFFGMADYNGFTDACARRYIQPGDYYLHLICTVGKARHSGVFSRFFAEQADGKALFLETHNEENVSLYRHMGFEIVKQTQWHGVMHCLMRLERNISS